MVVNDMHSDGLEIKMLELQTTVEYTYNNIGCNEETDINRASYNPVILLCFDF